MPAKGNMKAVRGARKGGKSTTRSAKAGVNFPVGRIQRYIKQGLYARRVGGSGGVYMAAVLEYVVAEIIEAAADVTDSMKALSITPRHIQLAIKKDDELSQLFAGCNVSTGGVLVHTDPRLMPKQKGKAAADGTQQM
jgi:histone H2A